MAELELPAKRGTFVEFRTGLINVCPVGRSCSYDERLEFVKFDQENNVRLKFKQALEEEFGDLGKINCMKILARVERGVHVKVSSLPWAARSL